MNSDDEDEIARPERLPIYNKGKEIFDMVNKITGLIPENDEYLYRIKLKDIIWNLSQIRICS